MNRMKNDIHNADCTVLWEDAWCIAVAKPSGVLTQAPPGIDSMEVRIKKYLQAGNAEKEPYLGVPHRLDRVASGAMIFAKTGKAAQRLAEQFQVRSVKKIYWALVEGNVEPEQGHWVDFMRKVPNEPRAELVSPDHPGGQKAELRYVKRGQVVSASWLEVELLTGRMHQIRVQTSSRDHPIWGDALYGSSKSFGPQHEDLRLNGIALHAHLLTLDHPKTLLPITVEAPLPRSWQDILHVK